MAEYTKPVVFKLGEENFGIDINLVMSIEQCVNAVWVPNSTDYIKGIISMRGQTVPIFDLKKKFGIKDSQEAQNTIIVNASGVIIAFDVDSVMEIRELDESAIAPMPLIVKKDDTQYLDRVAHIDNKLIILLDVEKLLSNEEAETVKKLAEEMADEEVN